MTSNTTITPLLMFDGHAEAAMTFYTSFQDQKFSASCVMERMTWVLKEA